MSGGTVTDKQYEFIKPIKQAMNLLDYFYKSGEVIGVGLHNESVQMKPQAYLNYFKISDSKFVPVGNEYVRLSCDCEGITFFTLCDLICDCVRYSGDKGYELKGCDYLD